MNHIYTERKIIIVFEEQYSATQHKPTWAVTKEFLKFTHE